MNPADSTDRPLPNSYWVVPGRFAAGEYPGAKNPEEAAARLQTLLTAGIDHFVDLTEPADRLEPYAAIALEEARRLGANIAHERHPITDLSVPRSPDEMTGILDAIDGALGAGRTPYLHCWGGVGRTGTVVGCWLVRHGKTGDEALGQLAEWWQGVAKVHRQPRSPETAEQFRYVREWTEPSREESPVSEVSTQDRFRGCLLGLAAGDALGTTLEFKKPGTFEPIDDMVGGGPFNLQPGQWTDDTSMALCLATSLIERDGFQATDQMQRYVRWWQKGYLSSTDHCFDIGTTVSAALSRFLQDGDPVAGSTDPYSAGNGSLMRLAPVPMCFASDAAAAIRMAADSSKTTHGAQEAVDACRYFAGLLVGALEGVDKETLLSPGYCPVEGLWESEPLVEEVALVANGSFKDRNPPEITGSGYVVRSLEAALWAFHHSDNFRDGALLAANLGDDADTTAAIYGQIAGAYYGVEGIPAAWREKLAMVDDITSMADDIFFQISGIPVIEFDLEPRDIREVGTVTEVSFRIAGVEVRWVSVIVSGHTVEQVLSYDVAEAEAVFRRPFDYEMDTGMRMAMYSADRIWLDETLHRVASATSYVLDGKCIRTAKIEHCDDIKPASAYYVITRADGTPVPSEPWSCVPGTPPISHRDLKGLEDDEDSWGDDFEDEESTGVPRAVVREFEAQLDEYIREWRTGLERALARLDYPEHPEVIVSEQAAGERLIVVRSPPRFVTKPNGQQVPIDDEGWGLTRSGRRDLRYKGPIGPPLP